MDKNLLKNLEAWHDNDEFEKIIDAITKIPENERDYNLKGQLARALNNTEKFEEALSILGYVLNVYFP